MTKHYSARKCIYCLCALAIMLTVHLFATGLPQKSRTIDETEIRALIKKSHDKDLEVSDQANQNLSKLDFRSVPTLLKILKKGDPCARIEAAQMVIALDKNNKEVVPQLVDTARGVTLRTFFHLQKEMMCRRGAAVLLATSPDGIRELIKMLKKGDQFERESAIFAFDELTETSDYPEEILPVMKEAIPVIAESGKRKERVMQCMPNEVLWQIVRHSPPELTEMAKRYVHENQE